MINTSFLIKGHTGEDVDGATAHLRIAFRGSGDVMSWASAVERFEPVYRTSTPPTLFHFLDARRTDGWQQTAFNSNLSHFLRDFKSFFARYSNKISGFTAKNVLRTEFSVHAWQHQVGGLFRVKRLRSLAECTWSNAVQVFATQVPAEALPNPLFFGEPGHALSKGADLLAICRQFLSAPMIDALSARDVAWWRSLHDELQQRVISPLDMAADEPPKQKRAYRTPPLRCVPANLHRRALLLLLRMMRVMRMMTTSFPMRMTGTRLSSVQHRRRWTTKQSALSWLLCWSNVGKVQSLNTWWSIVRGCQTSCHRGAARVSSASQRLLLLLSVVLMRLEQHCVRKCTKTRLLLAATPAGAKRDTKNEHSSFAERRGVSARR